MESGPTVRISFSAPPGSALREYHIKRFCQIYERSEILHKKIEVILNNMFIVQIIALCYYKNIIS